MANKELTLEKFKVLLNHFNDGVFLIEDGVFVYVNSVLSRLLNYPVDEIIGHKFSPFVHEADRDKVLSYYTARIRGEDAPQEYEFRVLSRQGEAIDVLINVGIYHDKNGSQTSIGTLKDLRESKKTMNDLARSREDIKSILKNMPDVFYRTDSKGVVTLMSPSVSNILGYEPEEMMGRPLSDFYCTSSEREKVLAALKKGGGKASQVEACLKHKDGSKRWILTNAYMRMDDDNNPAGVEGISRDISERKEMEDRLLKLSRYDDLTQVYNRRVFYSEAEKQLEIARRYLRQVAVLMMDLDYFKRVNDQYGHHAGDQVLKQFVGICKDSMRHTDFIGRTGGEEFAVFSPETDQDEAIKLAERICRRTRESKLNVDGEVIKYTVSIGVAIVGKTTDKIDNLLSSADKALYKAKASGRDCVRSFDSP
ncbi:MAG: diguanylate cyclase [Gammaproteobacteria bacterium]|nr:diguanylate cyclase [Gammaproteobacteria bacterium]